MHKILMIDDDEALAPPLRKYIQRYDMTLSSATHPKEGLKKIEIERPELIILDVMLPDMDGFEVCRTIRKTYDIPIIILTARGEVMDLGVGLELGADDYLPKPFEPRELVARIQNILRRSKNTEKQSDEFLQYGELSIDFTTQTVTLAKNTIALTTTEFGLLSLLARSSGKPFSRDDILNALKGIDSDLYTRAVDIAISRLRKKLRPLDCIKTVWGAGYSFVLPYS